MTTGKNVLTGSVKEGDFTIQEQSRLNRLKAAKEKRLGVKLSFDEFIYSLMVSSVTADTSKLTEVGV